MSIPTPFDGDAAAVQDAASGVLLQLRTMQHAAARDVPQMRERLREMLQAYVDLVMIVARSE